VIRSNELASNTLRRLNRGLPRFADISIRIRTNRVSSLSNRPQTAEPHSVYARDHIRNSKLGSRSESSYAKEIASATCRLTRKRPSLVDRASNVRIALHCSYPGRWQRSSSHTHARTHIQKDTRRLPDTAFSRRFRPCPSHWHGMAMQYCTVHVCTPRNTNNGHTAPGCRFAVQIGQMCHIAGRCRLLSRREISHAFRTGYCIVVPPTICGQDDAIPMPVVGPSYIEGQSWPVNVLRLRIHAVVTSVSCPVLHSMWSSTVVHKAISHTILA
jgi:hypothetical protein